MKQQISDSPIAGQAIADGPLDHLAEWLERSLGRQLTAFAVGTRPSELADFAHEGERPPPDTERRLRNLYAVTSLLAARDGPGSAREWLIEPNAELENRAPVELLREGQSPDAVWFAAAPSF
jgi:hypothetical protein